MTDSRQRDEFVRRLFGSFCAREGLDEVAATRRDEATVEAFLALECRGLRAHSVGTYRSVLVRESAAKSADRSRYSGSPAPAPYSDVEIAALFAVARSQSSELRVRNALVLLATTLGAGLRPRELAHLQNADVAVVDGECHVLVRGPRPRLVPVLAPYDTELLAIAPSRPHYLFRPGATRRDTKNLVGEIAQRLVRDPSDVALSTGRARSSYLCAHLERDTALYQLCELSGLEDVDSLLRYARHVPSAPQSKSALAQAARK